MRDAGRNAKGDAEATACFVLCRLLSALCLNVVGLGQEKACVLGLRFRV